MQRFEMEKRVAERARISRVKRLGFLLIAVAGTVAVIELMSCAAFPLLDARRFDFDDMRARQRLAAGLGVRAGGRIVGEAPDTGTGAEPIPFPDEWVSRMISAEVLHPYLGFVIDPNKLEGTNRFGFLGASDGLPKRGPEELVIAVTGGSVANIFCESGLPYLADALRRSGRFVDQAPHFECLALGGFKQPQQLLTLSYMLSLGAEYDYVINVDGFNEIVLAPLENVPNGVALSYPRAWYWRVQGIPENDTRLLYGEIARDKWHKARWAENFLGSPLRFSVTANLVWWAGDQLHARAIAASETRLRNSEGDAERYMATGPPGSRDGGLALYRELVALWSQSSRQLHRLASANGIEYIHVLQPNQYVPGSKPMSAMQRSRATDDLYAGKAIVEDAYPLLVESGRELAAQGISFVDATYIFQDVTEDIYIDNCCHFNARGNEILASAISEAMLRQGD
jgi:hypothetical protein